MCASIFVFVVFVLVVFVLLCITSTKTWNSNFTKVGDMICLEMGNRLFCQNEAKDLLYTVKLRWLCVHASCPVLLTFCKWYIAMNGNFFWENWSPNVAFKVNYLIVKSAIINLRMALIDVDFSWAVKKHHPSFCSRSTRCFAANVLKANMKTSPLVFTLYLT